MNNGYIFNFYMIIVKHWVLTLLLISVQERRFAQGMIVFRRIYDNFKVTTIWTYVRKKSHSQEH